jgi:hypothetical protein
MFLPLIPCPIEHKPLEGISFDGIYLPTIDEPTYVQLVYPWNIERIATSKINAGNS